MPSRLSVTVFAMLLGACSATAAQQPLASGETPPVPPAYAPGDHQHDADALRAAVNASAAACLRGDPSAAAAIYDRSVMMSTPELPDQGYDELLASLAKRCGAGSARMTPTFEDIRFTNSSALVAVTWTIEPPGRPDLASMIRELGYWERTAAGWRYMRGVRWNYRPVPPS